MKRWIIAIWNTGGWYDSLPQRYYTRRGAAEGARQANLLMPSWTLADAFTGRSRWHAVTEKTLYGLRYKAEADAQA